MSPFAPLPKFLRERHNAWRADGYVAAREVYQRLAAEGQSPKVMIISCCDSRTDPAVILSGKAGDYFVHRNIANFVPPYGEEDGTAATIEFGVLGLGVQHILVLGHSQCGGVQNCLAQCKGEAAPADALPSTSAWLKFIRPAYDAATTPSDEALAQQAIILSLNNLLTFPFIKEKNIALHGAFHDIASGDLAIYNPTTNKFESL